MPFALFIAGIAFGSTLEPHWQVVTRGGIAALALAWYWPNYGELNRPSPARSIFWLLAVLAGLAVFLLWIQLDHGWMAVSRDPRLDWRLADASLAWRYNLPRLASFTLVVPVMEELFWRSFLLRWLERRDFLLADPRRVRWRSFFATSLVFGLEHEQWFAGVLAGMTYNALYMRSRNLWVPILAHSVTNGALGLWMLFGNGGPF